MVKERVFNETYNSLKKHWFENGLTAIDFIATVLLVWTHILSTFIFLVYLQKSSKPVSRLCSVMAKLNKSLGINEEKLKPVKRRTYCALISLYILHVLSVVSSIDFARQVLAEKIAFHIPIYVMWFTVTGIFYWPLSTAVSFLITRLCFFGLMLQIQTFESKAPNNTRKDKKSEENNETVIEMETKITSELHEYIELGFSIRSTIATANGTFGGFLILDIGMCIFVTIITIYFTPLIFNAFSQSNFHSVKFSFGLHCFILAIKTALRWINFYRAGQLMANKCQNIKGILEDLLMEHQESLTKKVKTKLKILIKRFDDSAPIKPKSTFDLNFSTAVSAAGLIATYLVILVQFKQSNMDMALQKWKEGTENNGTAIFS